jgi:NAD+ diphosphatase
MTMNETGFRPCYGLAGTAGPVLVFPFVGNSLLLGADAGLPSETVLDALGPWRESLVFGMLDGLTCEMRVWPADTAIPPELGKGHYRQLWHCWEAERLHAYSRAQQLATWLQQHRFCGACGEALVTRADEPARECPACGLKAYPRISPVCIGLVRRGEELLLARSPHFPPGVYSALAGFLEAGESAEDCLRREIREEAGIEIANIRWFGSQTWPYPHSLMMGFMAEYASGELQPQIGEIEDLRWFRKDRLPALPHPSTIAYQMIKDLSA